MMPTMDGLPLRIWRRGVSYIILLPYIYIHSQLILLRLSKLPNPRRDLLPNLWPRFQPAHIAVITLARKRHCIRKPPNLHAIRVPSPLQRITVRMVQP